MKLILSGLVLLSSLSSWATEAETPCPAMNEETRVKIVDVKAKSLQPTKTTSKQ